jgi:hypothetical protein
VAVVDAVASTWRLATWRPSSSSLTWLGSSWALKKKGGVHSPGVAMWNAVVVVDDDGGGGGGNEVGWWWWWERNSQQWAV